MTKLYVSKFADSKEQMTKIFSEFGSVIEIEDTDNKNQYLITIELKKTITQILNTLSSRKIRPFILPFMDYSKIVIISSKKDINSALLYDQFKEYGNVIWVFRGKTERKTAKVLFETEDQKENLLANKDSFPDLNITSKEEQDAEMAEKDIKYKVFVSELPPNTNRNTIKGVFSVFGPVKRVMLKSNDSCVVTFEDEPSTKKCVDASDNIFLPDGQKITVSPYINPKIVVNGLKTIAPQTVFNFIPSMYPTLAIKTKYSSQALGQVSGKDMIKDYLTKTGYLGKLLDKLVLIYIENSSKINENESVVRQLCNFISEDFYDLATEHLKDKNTIEERESACDELYNEYFS